MANTVNLGTLRADVMALLDDESNLDVSANRANRCINLALDHVRHLLIQYPGEPFAAKDTITVVSGTVEYAIAAEIMMINKVTCLRSDATERALSPVTHREAEQYQDRTTVGQDVAPAYYYRKANYIGLLPKPQSAATVYVYSQKQPDALAADGTAIVAPPWVRNLVVWKAAAYAATSKGDRHTVELFEAQFAAERREMEFTLSLWQNHERERVRPMWDVDWSVLRVPSA